MKYIIIILLLTTSIAYTQDIRYDENGVPRIEAENIEETDPIPFDTVAKVLQEVNYYESQISELFVKKREAERRLKIYRKELIRLDVVLTKEMNASYSGPMMGLKKYKNDSIISIKPERRANGTIRINEVLEPLMEISTREEQIFPPNTDSLGSVEIDTMRHIEVITITDTTYIEQYRNLGIWKVISENSGAFQGAKYYRVSSKRGKAIWIKEDDDKIYFK